MKICRSLYKQKPQLVEEEVEEIEADEEEEQVHYNLIADMVLKIKKNAFYHSHKTKEEEDEATEEEAYLINSNIQCYYCKKYGHFEIECRKKQVD